MKQKFPTCNFQRTGTSLVEDRETVLVWAFRRKVAALAKTTDDFSSPGTLGELLANLFFLRLFFVRCGLKVSSVDFLMSSTRIEHLLSPQRGERR